MEAKLHKIFEGRANDIDAQIMRQIFGGLGKPHKVTVYDHKGGKVTRTFEHGKLDDEKAFLDSAVTKSTTAGIIHEHCAGDFYIKPAKTHAKSKVRELKGKEIIVIPQKRPKKKMDAFDVCFVLFLLSGFIALIAMGIFNTVEIHSIAEGFARG